MFQTNATQIIGVIIFAFAALFCARAFKWGPSRRKIWLAIGLVCAGFLAEVILGGRHMLGGTIGGKLKDMDLYSGRAAWQIALLVGFVCVAFMILRFFRVHFKTSDFATRLAVFAVTFLACLFIVEVISLHSVDAILYAKIGPVLFVGWLWLVLGVCICIAAWLSTREKSTV